MIHVPFERVLNIIPSNQAFYGDGFLGGHSSQTLCEGPIQKKKQDKLIVASMQIFVE